MKKLLFLILTMAFLVASCKSPVEAGLGISNGDITVPTEPPVDPTEPPVDPSTPDPGIEVPDFGIKDLYIIESVNNFVSGYVLSSSDPTVIAVEYDSNKGALGPYDAKSAYNAADWKTDIDKGNSFYAVRGKKVGTATVTMTSNNSSSKDKSWVFTVKG